jgi:hypothetical protein
VPPRPRKASIGRDHFVKPRRRKQRRPHELFGGLPPPSWARRREARKGNYNVVSGAPIAAAPHDDGRSCPTLAAAGSIREGLRVGAEGWPSVQRPRDTGGDAPVDAIEPRAEFSTFQPALRSVRGDLDFDLGHEQLSGKVRFVGEHFLKHSFGALTSQSPLVNIVGNAAC